MSRFNTLALSAALLSAATSQYSQRSRPEGNRQNRPHGTLVVSNMNDNTATVLDVESGVVLATLPTGNGPHEVAISHDGRWALVSNYGARQQPGSTITVVDIAKLAVVRTLTLAGHQRPHGMAFLRGDSLVAVTSESSQSILFVRLRDGAIVDTIPTRGRASHMLAMSARGDKIITGNIGDATISVLDLKHRETSRVMAVGGQPEGIAVTPDGHFVWAGSNRDSIVVIVDTQKGQAVDTVRGFGLPYRLAVSADQRLVVITDPVKAEVRIFDAQTHRERFAIAIPHDSLVATAEVPGSPSPEGVILSPDSRWAFVTLQGRNRVATIDLVRGTIAAYAPTGTWSDGIGYSALVLARKK